MGTLIRFGLWVSLITALTLLVLVFIYTTAKYLAGIFVLGLIIVLPCYFWINRYNKNCDKENNNV